MEQALQKLQITSLKSKQKKILRHISQGKDVLGILPTGYGKSACFIIPHLLSKKNVIVVSPLISLMMNQHEKLKQFGISSYCFNSHDTDLNPQVIQNLKSGLTTGILFFSPEKIQQHQTLITDLSKTDLIYLVVVDEAHCVLSWADFRDSYLSLELLREWTTCIDGTYPPILALTATAPPAVHGKITDKLSLSHPKIVKSSFRKPALSLTFKEKLGLEQDLALIAQEIKATETKTIIYVKSRKETDLLLFKLQESFKDTSRNIYRYHGELGRQERIDTQNNFQNYPKSVMIATVAFGMGVDIPDIHLIIHYGASKDIESYYQEIGRAGRDGGSADCLTLYSKSDFALNRTFVSHIKKKEDRDYQFESSQALEKLIRCQDCRMNQLVEYFGETSQQRCDRCDNCDATSPEMDSLVETKKPLPDVYLMFRALSIIHNQNFSCGITTLACILTGGKRKSLLTIMKEVPEYYSIRKMTQKKVREHLEKMLDEGYFSQRLLQNSSQITVMTPQGLKWLNDKKPKISQAIQTFKKNNFLNRCQDKFKHKKEDKKRDFHLLLDKTVGELFSPTETIIGSSKKQQNEFIQLLINCGQTKCETILTRLKTSSLLHHNGQERLAYIEGIKLMLPSQESILSTPKKNNSLYDKIKNWRIETAKKNQIPAFCVFGNKILEQLVSHQPKTLADLNEIKGVGNTIIDRYGPSILDIIGKHQD